MKNLMIALLLLASATIAPAQDLVVIHGNDSLNVKITKVKSGWVYFTFKYKDEVRNTLLPADSVNYYQYNFYKVAEVPSPKFLSAGADSKWRIVLNGGWSWRIAKTADNLNAFEKEYVNDLKSGHQLGVQAIYFFSDNIGMGLHYNAYFSSNSVHAAARMPNGMVVNGILSDDILINFIGASFNMRFLSKSNMNAFLMDIAIGYTGYRDNAAFITPVKITGASAGINYDFMYEWGLSKHIALGTGLSFKLGTLSSYKITQNNTTQKIKLNKDSYESLVRFDIGLGIHFR